ncbi:hypothetical protein ATANTOWER_032444 [Ataeniobius toweri]|uniref:Uncharacterized protein n=1 Tax=Ataeniobius toweri TaxID=208326 RepID=A0ABU7B0C7_9TELE|nr:hypothetical protein [Ataeniobius toweri]
MATPPETLLHHGLKEREGLIACLPACLPACCKSQCEFPPERNSEEVWPKPTEMDNDPCCLPEPEERYTGFILKAHLMRAEEKQAGAKFFLPPGEDKVDKGVNVPPTDLGRAWVVFWTDRGLCAMTV